MHVQLECNFLPVPLHSALALQNFSTLEMDAPGMGYKGTGNIN